MPSNHSAEDMAGLRPNVGGTVLLSAMVSLWLGRVFTYIVLEYFGSSWNYKGDRFYVGIVNRFKGAHNLVLMSVNTALR